MIGVSKDLGLVVTIPQNRYEQLLDLETRVDVAVERMTNDEYCDIEDVLCIIGTELALQRVDEIREKEKCRNDEYLRSLKGEEDSNESNN